jgi:hypothetical protein
LWSKNSFESRHKLCQHRVKKLRRKTRKGTPEKLPHTHTHTHNTHTHQNTLHTHTHTHTTHTQTYTYTYTQDHLAVNLGFFAIHLKHGDIVVPVHLVPRGMPVTKKEKERGKE